MSGSTTWVSGSGTWGTGSDWTGGTPGSSTNATISGATSETITIAAAAVANTLTLSDANAVLLDLSSLTLGGLVLSAGTLEVGAGTLTVADTGADSNAGTITSDGTLVGTVSVTGSSFTNTGLILNDADVETFSDTVFTNGAGGTLTVGALGTFTTTYGTATSKSGTTYTTTATPAILSAGLETISGTSFTNAGVINAVGGSLAINETTFTNSGTFNVGSTTGTYVSESGTVSSSPTLGIGTATLATGSVSITTGTFTNSGTVAASAGTLSIAASVFSNTGSFTDKAGTIAVGSSFTNSGTFTDAGATMTVGSATSGSFVNSNTMTISAGTLDVMGASFNNTSTGSITVSGKKAVVDLGSASLTNAGHITVSNGILVLGSGTSVTGSETAWNSTGSITTTGGTVVLDGTLTLANLGEVKNSGGKVEIGGYLNNTGNTLLLGTGSTLGTISLGTYFNATTFANYGGEIEGGIIHNAGGGLVANFGTLSDLTYEGTLAIGGAKQQGLVLEDGVTLTNLTDNGAGTIVMGTGATTDDYNNYLGIYGSTTLSNVNITVGSALYTLTSAGVSTIYGNNFIYGGGYGPNGAPATLTLASNVTINEASVTSTKSGTITHHAQFDQISAGAGVGDTLINQGTIIAAQVLGDFDIEGQFLINQGNIALSGGGTLEINTGEQGPGYASYVATNTGTITSVNSYVELGGTLTAGFLQHFTATGGHTYLQSYGYAYNKGGSFSVGSGATGVANQILLGGTIIGGTIVDSGNGLVADGGALDGVIYQGNLNVQDDATYRDGYTNVENLYIWDGITLEGAGGSGASTVTVNSANLYGGQSAGGTATGSTTISNAVINLGDTAGTSITLGTSTVALDPTIGEGPLYAGTFTLGASTILNTVGTQGTLTAGTIAGNVFSNLGTINADTLGGTLSITGPEFSNAGVVNISAGATIKDTTTTVLNTGTIDDAGTLIVTGNLAGNGTLDVAGTASIAGSLDPSQSIYFGSGTGDLILGTAEGLTNAITVAANAEIEFAGITITSATAAPVSGSEYDITVTATGASGAISFSLTDVTTSTGLAPVLSFGTATDGNAYLDIQPCFAQGTRVATPHGDVAVENLIEGDMVLTVSGGAKPVKWIGHRHVDCRTDQSPAEYWPVRIARNAFGPARPHTDLLLSPDHAVFVDGALIPAKHLINRVSITQEPRAHITYWHVELDQHDAILAEGLPCETYLDTGNRTAFANADVVALRPSFERPAEDVWAAAWADKACGPLVQDGPVLARLRESLADRAVALGLELPATADVAITGAARMAVTVPADITAIRLVSPSGRVAGDRPPAWCPDCQRQHQWGRAADG